MRRTDDQDHPGYEDHEDCLDSEDREDCEAQSELKDHQKRTLKITRMIEVL